MAPETKVGLFLNVTADYHRRLVDETLKAGDALGVAVQVFDAQDTAAKQAQDLIRFARENAGGKACVLVVPRHDASVLGGTEDPTLRVARRVLGIGIGWVTINHGRED